MPSIDVSYVKELVPIDIERHRYSILDLVKVDTFTLVVLVVDTGASKFEQVRQLVDFSFAKLQLCSASLDSGFAPRQRLACAVRSAPASMFRSGATPQDIASSILGYFGK